MNDDERNASTMPAPGDDLTWKLYNAITEAIRLLEPNTYAAMQDARQVLREAIGVPANGEVVVIDSDADDMAGAA